MVVDSNKLISYLRTLPAQYKLQIHGTVGAKIVCPFHKDTDPSLSINLNPRHSSNLAVGLFHCLGCGEKGGWNALAEKTGLPQIEEGYQENIIPLITRELEEKEKTFKKITSDWDVTKIRAVKDDWRGIPLKTLEKVRAREGIRFKERVLLFPVKIRGQLEGVVLARNDTHEKYPSYLNSSGAWTKEFGLFGWDNAIRIRKKRESRVIVLVEGPRDCLVCQDNGIPAMAILGTRTLSKDKFTLLPYYAGADKVIILLDGDGAGRKATKELVELLKGIIDVHVVKLWRYYIKKGKLRKRESGKKYPRKYNVDPATLPKSTLKSIRRMCDD